MPWKPKIAISDLEREKHQLQIKLLQANSALRLKVLYCQRLEFLVGERNRRIDELNAKLEHAYTVHRRLEREAEHLARMIAIAPARLFAPRKERLKTSPT